MTFYQSLGFLVFGSRLKRLSEQFLNDVNNIYKTHKIPFDASWFPIFYILSRKNETSLMDISNELNISHSAISQLVSSLQNKGLIQSIPSKEDARKKLVAFTPKGKKLLKQIEPIWSALNAAMEQLSEETANSRMLLPALTDMEDNLQKSSLFERIEQNLK